MKTPSESAARQAPAEALGDAEAALVGTGRPSEALKISPGRNS